MSNNKKVHKQLALIYGEKCMFLASHCDNASYRTYQGRYTSKEMKRLVKNLTVHHLKHRSEGGKATVENCSLVNELAHRYLHSLPREYEEIINDRIRKWKECKVIETELEMPIQVNFASISVTKDKHVIIERLRRDEEREFQRQRKEYEDR